MTRLFVLVAALILASPAFAQSDANAKSRELLAARHLDGAVVVKDVRSGAVIADVRTGENWEQGVLPLSTVKLFVAALAWDRGLHTAIDIPALIAQGSDADGRTLALELRHAAGTAAILADFTRLGFPPCGAHRTMNCFSLSAKTSDADWASTLSLGETNMRITLDHFTDFLCAVGRNGVGQGKRILNIPTTLALQRAMRAAVVEGTAAAARDRMPIGYSIGGKTGTGGTDGAEPSDGIFAGQIFDARGRPHYAFTVYVRGGGQGGGAAAEIAADLAAFVVSQQPKNAPDGL